MKTYTTPVLSVYGDAVALIQGSSTGNSLDKAFPANTCFSALTFSACENACSA